MFEEKTVNPGISIHDTDNGVGNQLPPPPFTSSIDLCGNDNRLIDLKAWFSP